MSCTSFSGPAFPQGHRCRPANVCISRRYSEASPHHHYHLYTTHRTSPSQHKTLFKSRYCSQASTSLGPEFHSTRSSHYHHLHRIKLSQMRTYLIVLGIRRGRLNGDGLRAQALNVGRLALVGRRQRRRLDLGQPLGQLPPDADPDDGVREISAVENRVCWAVVSIQVLYSIYMSSVSLAGWNSRRRDNARLWNV